MHLLVGHAIVSADDRIADASGAMPQALQNERDWEIFQAALDTASLVLLGRASHEAAPNPKERRRLIASGSINRLEERDDGVWFNPGNLPLQACLDQLLPRGGLVAVPGGQQVFDLVGAAGFHEFHLARAHRVTLPHGRGLFKACEHGMAAEAVLSGGGLEKQRETLIDPEAEVTLAIWGRP